MTSITLRAATARDLDALVQLFEAYRAFYQREAAPLRASEFLKERIANGDSTIIMAFVRDDEHEQAAGFVQLYRIFSSLRMRPAWIVNDLFVAPAYRKDGIARRLMQACHDAARNAGVATLSLETAPDNRAAQKLYESLGYTRDESMLHYALEL